MTQSDVTEERDKLATENDHFKTEKQVREKAEADKAHDVARDKMIQDSEIPETGITDIFRKNVREAKTDEDAKAIIDDRKKIVEGESGKVRGNGPVDARRQESGDPDDEAKQKEKDKRIKERLDPNRR